MIKNKPKDLLTKEYLIENFVNKKKSIRDIKYELGLHSTNSVTQFLNKFGITRPNIRDRSHITKDILYNKYIIENKSLKTIAKEFGLSNKNTIKRLLIKHNITLRTRSYKTSAIKKAWTKKRTGYEEINGRYWYSIVHSAKLRNLEFNITIQDAWQLYLYQNKQCAQSGVDIVFKNIGNNQNEQTASLDRIDSSKGYTIDNIQWVHKTINRMKTNLSVTEFHQWCKLVIEHKEKHIL